MDAKGLKLLARWRNNPDKRRIPTDDDGAFRVEGRLDCMTVKQVFNPSLRKED